MTVNLNPSLNPGPGAFPEELPGSSVLNPQNAGRSRADWRRSNWATLPCLGLALLLSCAFLAGCKTTSASGAKVTVSTVIQGHSAVRVLATTKDVFVKRGYEVVPAPGMSLTFEKKGSGADRLLYGNWMEAVYLRARVTVVELDGGRCAIDCVASYVRDPNGGMLEEEISRPGEGPYRKMLQEVEKTLAIPDPGYSKTP